MFTRTLTYKRLHTTVPFIMDVLSDDMKTLHEKIDGLRSGATGFRGETTSTSSDNLEISYVSTWDSEDAYMAFYNANKSDIDSWDAYKTQYVGQYNVAMFDQHITSA